MSAVWMPELLVRPALTNLLKAPQLQSGNDFSWLENRDRTHIAMSRWFTSLPDIKKLLTDSNCFRADELAVEGRFAVLEQHLHNFYEIISQLFRTFPLRVGSLKSGDVPHVRTRSKVSLENCLECAHQLLRLDLKEIYTCRTPRHFAAIQ
jgi:hypothetical protein